MRVGDEGFIVDYIVSKLRDKYPDMPSGESLAWTNSNTQYLIKYLKEEMPDFIQMVNTSSGGYYCHDIFFLEKSGTFQYKEFNPLTQEDLVTTLGSIVNTGRGTPYKENPLQLISFPVEAGKRYRVHLDFNDSSNISKNYADPSQDWSIRDYMLAGVMKGHLIGTNLSLDGNVNSPIANLTKIPVGYTEEDEVSRLYIQLIGKYGIPFTQSIKVSGKDELYLVASSGKNKVYLSDRESAVTLDNGRYRILPNLSSGSIRLVDPTGADKVVISKGTKITFKSDSAYPEYIPQGNGTGVNLLNSNDPATPPISNLEIYMKPILSGGVEVSLDLVAEGQSVLEIGKEDNSILSGSEIILRNEEGTRRIYRKSDNTYDIVDNWSDGNTQGKLTTKKIDVDGKTYSYSGSGNGWEIPSPSAISETTNLKFKDISEEKSVEKSIDFFIDIPEEGLPQLTEVTGYTKEVNEIGGVNLILQIPQSTLNYSLVQMPSTDDDVSVNYEELNDRLLVTSNYLDLILLDRTITKYSPRDDIEWIQEMAMSIGYAPVNPKYLNGEYDNHLRDTIKNLQKSPILAGFAGGLGRTTYITGWVDPETEALLESKYGY